MLKNTPTNYPQIHADNLHKYGGCPHSRALYKYNDISNQPERKQARRL